MARPKSKHAGKARRITFSCFDSGVLEIVSSIQREKLSSFISRSVLYYASTPEGAEVVAFIRKGGAALHENLPRTARRTVETPSAGESGGRGATDKTRLKKRGPFGGETVKKHQPAGGGKAEGPVAARGASPKPEGSGHGKKPKDESLSGILGDFDGSTE